ncbi:hypothetical protein T492DRAFT_401214 [Pavlovales sp. CCMP2436]|nr:hypothetical protein T492DRAFT_401214 [Pavlovales sp. CCMP2436]
MFAGGSTRGLWAGAGLTTAYATDVPVCQDGLRHDAKFYFLQLLHSALREAAGAIVRAESAPGTRLEAENAGDGEQFGFRYGNFAFIENNGTQPTRVSLDALGCVGANFDLGARSAALVELMGAGAEQALSEQAAFEQADFEQADTSSSKGTDLSSGEGTRDFFSR